MAKQNKAGLVVWLRRLVQTGFLLLFLYLFLDTTFHDDNTVGRAVTFFFELDPLILLATWLGNSVVPGALFLSLITVVVTLVFGRWFCGWVCPFGTLHNATASLRRQTVQLKLKRGVYSPYQKWKYYVLIAFLVGALLGANVVGWLDPISFFFRSLSTAVYPALNQALQDAFAWLYHRDPGIGSVRVTVVSEPVYRVLRDVFLAPDVQPQYQWSLLIGGLFLFVVGLNLYRPRFWCRYVCPLGALLGAVGKNPVLRLRKDTDRCNECRLCVADCPGGADPHLTAGWKPSECFFCWNCRSACPHRAIGFGFEVPEKQSHEKTSA
jgi:polyferredoxin